jgi:hypothetical protein
VTRHGRILVPFFLLGVASCGDGEPLLFPAPNAAETEWAHGRSGTAGRPIPSPPLVRVRDARGNPVPGVEVEFRVEEGGGSVRPAGVITDARGVARPEAWVLGEVVGPNVLVADMGHLGEATFEALGEPGPPDRLELESASNQEARVATAVPEPPAVRVQDRFGNAVPGVEVVFLPDGGSGVVGGSPGISSPEGLVAAGSWTLGTTAGMQRVRAIAQGVPAASFLALASPGPPASLHKEGGDQQTGPAGATLSGPLTVRVADQYGNPVTGERVTFEPAPGSGFTEPPEASTGQTGRVQASWTLGSGTGTQRLTARTDAGFSTDFTATAVSVDPPPPGSEFQIRLHFVQTPTLIQRQAFENAAARWESVVVGDLPPVQMSLPAGSCGSGSPALEEIVDDLLVFVFIEPIDGVGGALAQAGPCWIRTEGLLPIVGLIRVDSADIGALTSQGLLEIVILHEIGHVLGLGTLWDAFEHLRNPSLPDSPGADTHFDGPRALAAFDQAGGAGYTGGKVPVENTLGGTGTRDSHWRRSVFENELMIGFITGAEAPLSRITAASLEDLGYEVDLAAADAYTLPLGLRAPPMPAGAIHLGDDVYRGPIGVVDPWGRVLGTFLPPGGG